MVHRRLLNDLSVGGTGMPIAQASPPQHELGECHSGQGTQVPLELP